MSAVTEAAARGPSGLVAVGQWLGASDPTTAVSVALVAICVGIGVVAGLAVAIAERDRPAGGLKEWVEEDS